MRSFNITWVTALLTATTLGSLSTGCSSNEISPPAIPKATPASQATPSPTEPVISKPESPELPGGIAPTPPPSPTPRPSILPSPIPTALPTSVPVPSPIASPISTPSPEARRFWFKRLPDGSTACLNSLGETGLNDMPDFEQGRLECAHFNARFECDPSAPGSCNFKSKSFAGSVFHEAVNLNTGDLTGAHFESARFQSVFSCMECRLNGANFTRTRFERGVQFQKSFTFYPKGGPAPARPLFTGAVFLGNSSFADAYYWTGADFSNAALTAVSFAPYETSWLGLDYFTFDGARLDAVYFTRVGAKKSLSFKNAQFLGSSLFMDSDLEEVSFERATMKQTRFCNVHLHGSNFRGADLERALLLGVDLTQVKYKASPSNDLAEANFRWATFGKLGKVASDLCVDRVMFWCRDYLTTSLRNSDPTYPLVFRDQERCEFPTVGTLLGE